MMRIAEALRRLPPYRGDAIVVPAGVGATGSNRPAAPISTWPLVDPAMGGHAGWPGLALGRLRTQARAVRFEGDILMSLACCDDRRAGAL